MVIFDVMENHKLAWLDGMLATSEAQNKTPFVASYS
jgi:hypothetical protein